MSQNNDPDSFVLVVAGCEQMSAPRLPDSNAIPVIYAYIRAEVLVWFFLIVITNKVVISMSRASRQKPAPKRAVHPTGWFEYARIVPGPLTGQTHYADCTLLRDLDFDAIQSATPDVALGVTFHQDAACRRGARFPCIATMPGQMVGWDANDECVLDLPVTRGHKRERE